jgi:hypothetical protein
MASRHRRICSVTEAPPIGATWRSHPARRTQLASSEAPILYIKPAFTQTTDNVRAWGRRRRQQAAAPNSPLGATMKRIEAMRKITSDSLYEELSP